MRRSAALPVDCVHLVIDGHWRLVEPAGDTVIFNMGDDRGAITSRTSERPIELVTVEPDEDAVMDAKRARVAAAAAGPRVPRAQRPSVKLAAQRASAKAYHEATWNHGFSEGQARFVARPLSQRVTEADVPALVELALGAALADPELRAQLRAALDATELEAALV